MCMQQAQTNWLKYTDTKRQINEIPNISLLLKQKEEKIECLRKRKSKPICWQICTTQCDFFSSYFDKCEKLYKWTRFFYRQFRAAARSVSLFHSRKKQKLHITRISTSLQWMIQFVSKQEQSERNHVHENAVMLNVF